MYKQTIVEEHILYYSVYK